MAQPDPWISCIMLARGRPELAQRSLHCWLAQTWEARELVILDDADMRAFGTPPAHEMIQYHLLPRRLTVGAKRNLACSRAQGEIIAHWDSDDWYAPERLADQVKRLIESGRAVTGYHICTFEDLRNGQKWLYNGAICYALGASLMYRREFWHRHPFTEEQVGEDNTMVGRARGERALVTADGRDMLIASIHPGNASPRQISGPTWERL